MRDPASTGPGFDGGARIDLERFWGTIGGCIMTLSFRTKMRYPVETTFRVVRDIGQGGTLHAPDYQAETGQCVLIGRMLGRVTDKWTVLIVRVLGRGPRRFNRLRKNGCGPWSTQD